MNDKKEKKSQFICKTTNPANGYLIQLWNVSKNLILLESNGVLIQNMNLKKDLLDEYTIIERFNALAGSDVLKKIDSCIDLESEREVSLWSDCNDVEHLIISKLDEKGTTEIIYYSNSGLTGVEDIEQTFEVYKDEFNGAEAMTKREADLLIKDFDKEMLEAGERYNEQQLSLF